MKYTWGDIEILSLQKMFLNNQSITTDDLNAMRTDRKYAIYLNAMPAVANEGLLRLMSVGTPLVKKYTISYNVPEEVYTYKDRDSRTIINEDYVIEVGIAKSYYFEVNDDATIIIEQNNAGTWETLTTINHVSDASKSFETVKGNITNTNENEIRFTFSHSGYLYNIRNLAVYGISFRFEEDIYEYTQKQRYDLQTLIPDLYEISSIEFEKDGQIGKFDAYYLLEGDKTLVIDSNYVGNFIITYKAYPTKITNNTSDSYKFTLPSEMVALLPLYIASELYKDDDISVATMYRNQFEMSLANLKSIEEPEEFANLNNWM